MVLLLYIIMYIEDKMETVSKKIEMSFKHSHHLQK